MESSIFSATWLPVPKPRWVQNLPKSEDLTFRFADNRRPMADYRSTLLNKLLKCHPKSWSGEH